MKIVEGRRSFIDPSYTAFYEDRLFDLNDVMLNRDNQLLPFARLRASLESRHVSLQTADYLVAGPDSEEVSDYYSLGIVENYKELAMQPDVRLRAFVILEPPVVAPALYKALPELTAAFERVYVHNTTGDGYSMEGVDMSKLRQIYWPLPHNDVLTEYWGNEDRLNRIVVINGNHIPVDFNNELYSQRIEAMSGLARLGIVDLYGRGWSKWWARSSMWLPYWRNRKALMSIYQGACESKYEVLSRYRFSLCFENMEMSSYLTEKLFDCLYAGAIPVYFGAPNVASLIPSDVYINCRAYNSWSDLWTSVSAMSNVEIDAMRNAGQAFLKSETFLKYYNFLSDNVFSEADSLSTS